jgi:polyhydroxyalkanoate synthesis regulator phasin
MDVTLKNLLLAGIGTVAYSYEKALDIIDELVKKGELTFAQGKQFNEELKRTVRTDKSDEKHKVQAVTIEELKEVISSLNLATKQDIEELKQRIENLENR